MSGVAVLRSLGNATAQLLPDGATGSATEAQHVVDKSAAAPMTGAQLRALLRAQQQRNGPPQPAQQEGDAGTPHRNTDSPSCAVALPTKRNNATDDGPAYWWRVHRQDGGWFDYCALPEQTREEVEARYPGATVEPDRDPSDDRRTCTQCANLAQKDKRCLAADRGELPWGAAPGYRPMAHQPQRCACFSALPDDPDQRVGLQRWPSLAIARTDRGANE